MSPDPLGLELGCKPPPIEQYKPSIADLETLDKAIKPFLPEDWTFDSKKRLDTHYKIDQKKGTLFAGPKICILPTEDGSHSISIEMGNKYVKYIRNQDGTLTALNNDSIHFPKGDENLWGSWCRDTVSTSLGVAKSKGLLDWSIKEYQTLS